MSIDQKQTDSHEADPEIDLREYWAIVKKHKVFIISFVAVCVLATAANLLFKDNIYEASAVIMPVESQSKLGGVLSSLATDFSGIAGLAGISVPGAPSTYEMEGLLNSNVLREKVINDNNLLPVLFYDSWDVGNQEWIQPTGLGKGIKKFKRWLRSLLPRTRYTMPEKDHPTVWDGIRLLEKEIIKVKTDKKTNQIRITAQINDPQLAAALVDDFLKALTDHMSSEAKRVANTNRKYLEEQLRKAEDPVVRQKIYSMLTRQVETALMAEVKENFAFKVIDPPRAPDRKVRPKRFLLTLVSLFFSILIAAAISIYRENRARMMN